MSNCCYCVDIVVSINCTVFAMKRRDDYNHMDRNHTAINGNYQKPLRTNIVSPEFRLGQLWIQEQESNGVKIIELDSNSSNNDAHDDEDRQSFSHAWSYINQDRFRISQSPTNDHQVNYKAREYHRQYNTRYKQESSPEDKVTEESCVRDFYSKEPDRNDAGNDNKHKSSQKTDCFTITNPCPKTSDSSSDVEYIGCNDMQAEEAWDADDRYYDEILTYDSNIDTEKRTIYIYSFKNKHLFTEIDDPNVSNGSSTSTDVGEEQIKENSNGRVSSPIPNNYVPKLNLLQPPKLPTVAEITEPKSSEGNLKSKYEAKMPKGWFQNISRRYQDNEYKRGSNNLINWMSLSPREKRRRSRSAFCENCRHQVKLDSVREASPIAEDDQTKNNTESKSSALGDTSRIDDKSRETDNIEIDNHVWKDENRLEDRGDHLHQRFKIKIKPKSSSDPIKITEPIEKLDSNNWIGDETIVVREKSSHQLQNMDAIENVSYVEGDVSKRLWENNMVLLKPSDWSAFYPVDNSVPSLHISLETEIEEVSWFTRIIRCLKCFK